MNFDQRFILLFRIFVFRFKKSFLLMIIEKIEIAKKLPIY